MVVLICASGPSSHFDHHLNLQKTLIIACILLFLVAKLELHQPWFSLKFKRVNTTRLWITLLTSSHSNWRHLALILVKSWKVTSSRNWCTGCINLVVYWMHHNTVFPVAFCRFYSFFVKQISVSLYNQLDNFDYPNSQRWQHTVRPPFPSDSNWISHKIISLT